MSSIVWALLQVWLDFPTFLGYLKGQSFFKPLSPEEEKIVIDKYLQGDEAARITLIERNMRLVAHVIKKFHPSHEQIDDYISIGTIGLIKAISSYTPEKKTKLATYAARCIENEILMHLRAQKKVQRDISLFEPIGVDREGQSLMIRDLLQLDEKSALEQIEDKDLLKKLYDNLEVLDERELEIIMYRFGLFDQNSHTQKEIAKKLTISRSYVSRIEKRALIKLYQKFQLSENIQNNDASSTFTL